MFEQQRVVHYYYFLIINNFFDIYILCLMIILNVHISFNV